MLLNILVFIKKNKLLVFKNVFICLLIIILLKEDNKYF